MINPKFKKGFFGYQRALWLAGQAYNEANKPFNFAHLTVPWATYLAVQGFKLPTWVFIVINIFVVIAAVGIGRLLEKLNVISYNQTLSNRQSPEIMEILETIRELKEKMK